MNNFPSRLLLEFKITLLDDPDGEAYVKFQILKQDETFFPREGFNYLSNDGGFCVRCDDYPDLYRETLWLRGPVKHMDLSIRSSRCFKDKEHATNSVLKALRTLSELGSVRGTLEESGTSTFEVWSRE